MTFAESYTITTKFFTFEPYNSIVASLISFT